MGKNKSTKIKKMRKLFRHSRKRSKGGAAACDAEEQKKCMLQQRNENVVMDNIKNNLYQIMKLKKTQNGTCNYTLLDLIVNLQYGWLPMEVVQELIKTGQLLSQDKNFINSDITAQTFAYFKEFDEDDPEDFEKQTAIADAERRLKSMETALNYNKILKNINNLLKSLATMEKGVAPLLGLIQPEEKKGMFGWVTGAMGAIKTTVKNIGFLQMPKYISLIRALKAGNYGSVLLSNEISIKSLIKNVLIIIIEDGTIVETKLQPFIEPYSKQQLLKICNQVIILIEKIEENKVFMCNRDVTIDEGIKVQFTNTCETQGSCSTDCSFNHPTECRVGWDEEKLTINKKLNRQKGAARVSELQKIDDAGANGPFGYKIGGGKKRCVHNKSKYKKHRSKKRKKYTYKKGNLLYYKHLNP